MEVDLSTISFLNSNDSFSSNFVDIICKFPTNIINLNHLISSSEILGLSRLLLLFKKL